MKKIFYFLVLSCQFLFSEITKTYCEEYLLKLLSSTNTDISIKIYILNRLPELETKIFYQELKKLLQDNNNDIKLHSAYVLLKSYKDKSAQDVLLNLIKKKPVVKNPESPTGRAKLFRENKIRADAIKILGNYGDEKVVDVIKECLKEDDGNIIDASWYALSKLHFRGIIKLDIDPTEIFYSGLKELNPRIRVTAVKYLGELGDRRSVQPLVLRLKDNNKDVVRESILSLCKIGDISVLQELFQFKSDKDDNIRATFAEGLGYFAESIKLSTEPAKIESLNKIKRVLNELYNDPIGMVRINASVSLLRLGDRSGIEFIKKGLVSSDSDIRIYCIESLGRYGNTEDIKLLQPYLQDKELVISVATYVSMCKLLSK